VTRAFARRTTVAAALVAAALTLAACGSDATVKETQDGKVTVSGKGARTKVTISGENGAAVTYNARAVPSDFPGDVPLPAGLTLRNATSATRDGRHFFQLSYDLRTSARVALGNYTTRLGAAGFSADAVDGPTSDRAPSPLRADGKGWHVVAIASSGRGAHSMIVSVDDA
jgi:hypothetical protein